MSWNIFALISLVSSFLIFYFPIFSNNLPIPSDSLVGLYHPFRDLYSSTNPNGIPYDNFLVTDPVRQTIPWKFISLEIIKSLSLPLWNPYEMTGKPLMGNFQSSPFYPLNIILILADFKYSWSFFIFLQQALIAIGMWLYLKKIKLSLIARSLGTVSLTFSGFVIAWLEWGTVIHTFLYLPFLLYALSRNDIKGYLIFGLSLLFSFLAGHLQTFVYIFAFSTIYAIIFYRKQILPLTITVLTVFLLNAFQSITTIRFLLLSSRSHDQNPLTNEGFFIPIQHLIQFVAPDYFGNPSTLNYFGVWNYAEFVGYLGVGTLILATLSLILFKKSKLVKFFSLTVLTTLILATQNQISEIPYSLQIPIFSSTQPTRIISLTVFSISVLAAIGVDNILKLPKKRTTIIISVWLILIFILILFTNFTNSLGENKSIALRNLILPTLLMLTYSSILLAFLFTKRRIFLFTLLLVLVFDVTRFAGKFTPFSDPMYFFPESKIIKYLSDQQPPFRIHSTDNRILAPNISTFYKIESIAGYDPLYLDNYAKFIASITRESGSIEKPFGFNRIIAPTNLEVNILSFLNVKYILSFSEINEENYIEIMREGETILYENKKVQQRAFFVTETINSETESQAALLLKESDLSKQAITQNFTSKSYSEGEVKLVSYSPNSIIYKTKNADNGFLVISDAIYPTWKAKINNQNVDIINTNIAFRGIEVPSGENTIEFYNTLF